MKKITTQRSYFFYKKLNLNNCLLKYDKNESDIRHY